MAHKLVPIALCMFNFVSDYVPHFTDTGLHTGIGKMITPICHNGYHMTGYNTHYKMPHWTGYLATPGNLTRLEGGRKEFTLDPQVDETMQGAVNSRAYNSTYNKGHLCPSHITSWDKTEGGPWWETYLMTNVAPQYGSFNQIQWSTDEEEVINWVVKNNKPLHIITGTALRDYSAPRFSWDNIAVPDYYFKVYCNPEDGQSRGVIATNDADATGWDTFVSVDDVSRMSGLSLFPADICKTNKYDETYWKI